MSINQLATTELDWAVIVFLALLVYSQADQFYPYQADSNKAEQIDLNSLVVQAVDIYFRPRGFKSNIDQSTSWDSAMQTLTSAANWIVVNRRKCLPVLPAMTVGVPLKAWADRIGYITAQLIQVVREVMPLSFVNQAAKLELRPSQLRSLAELLGHLNQVRPLVNLGQWLQGLSEIGWQAVESQLSPQPELAFNYRRSLEAEVRQYKLVTPGAASGQSVAMMITTTPASKLEIDICVEARPPMGQTYLPANLQLMVLDQASEVILDAQVGSNNQHLQLEFTGEPGDQFDIRVALNDVSVTESFVI